jgi:hypothetical protein
MYLYQLLHTNYIYSFYTAVIYVYILPFSDTLHTAWVYRKWIPDDGWECQPKHVGVYRMHICKWCAVAGINKLTQPLNFYVWLNYVAEQIQQMNIRNESFVQTSIGLSSVVGLYAGLRWKMRMFCLHGEGPRSRPYGRTTALRLFVQPYDEDEDEQFFTKFYK